MLIEQAIFTSTQSDRLAGYQLAAQSSGIHEADLRELSAWGPSHDSLLESGADATSLNFHPLPSGAFCVSKTAQAGSEYSGRSGQNIYTQCLVVPTTVLASFSNNPFALIAAAFAQGTLRVHEPVPVELEPFRLGGRAAVLDHAALGQLQAELGTVWIGALAEAAVGGPALAIAGAKNPARVIAGLFSCLPLECRTRFSFSSGLKYSPRRPFRVFVLPGDRVLQRRLLRGAEVSVLDFAGKPPKRFSITSGWGGLVASALATGNKAFLSSQLAIPRPQLTVADLPQLGDRLLERMAAKIESADRPTGPFDETGGHATIERTTAEPFTESREPADGQRRADAPHRRKKSPEREAGVPYSTDALVADLDCGPAHVLGEKAPRALATLERLDDTVFEAIAGKPGALDALRLLWPTVLAQLDESLLDESREQYVRHALKVWRECQDDGETRNPALAVQVLDVVCVLYA